MIVHMLDTNAVSHALRRHPAVLGRLATVPMESLCVSVVTAAELYYGLARRPEAAVLRRAVEELLRRVAVLTWDHTVARQYGELRALLETAGRRPLSALDTQIAAHARSLGAVLITSDQAFKSVPGLLTEDWTLDARAP